MKFLFVVILLGNIAFSLDYKLLLNSYYNPNRLVFRLHKSAIQCSLLGVAVPFYSNNNQCVSEEFRKMSNLSIGFFQNNLDLEQLYSVSIENGFCVVKYKNLILNEEIIKAGYGVVNSNGVLDSDFLDRLLHLQSVAIENRNGLWNSFYDEMECFRDSY